MNESLLCESVIVIVASGSIMLRQLKILGTFPQTNS
jgi:hypothetical protein